MLVEHPWWLAHVIIHADDDHVVHFHNFPPSNTESREDRQDAYILKPVKPGSTPLTHRSVDPPLAAQVAGRRWALPSTIIT
jgi:hypothetical protein